MKRKFSKILIPVFLAILFNASAVCQESRRDRWEQPEKVMDAIGVKPGMVIGEIGAGRGYFTFKLADRIGDEGKIYANDISESELKHLEERIKNENNKNIEIVVGKETEPLFPEKNLDMIFMCFVFHDLTKPVDLVKNFKPYLKKGAHLVILDGDPERYTRYAGHCKTKEEVLNIMKKTGFDLHKIETFLPRHNIYIFK
ncbi:class I SAM-dependent methyltransferase [candidate division KSB1 bacterium]